MQVSGTQVTENGTFESTKDLLKSKIPPGQIFSAQIINGTLAESAEVSNNLRTGVMRDAGKAQNIDTSA